MRKHLPGLQREQLASGRIRIRVRPKGEVRRKIALTVPEDHPTFMSQYEAARKGVAPENTDKPVWPRSDVRVVIPNAPKYKLSYMLNKARERANRKGFSFEIDMDWLVHIYRTQRKRCALSGMPMTFEVNNGKMPFAPSIDRIDNSIGYTPENCRLVCAMVNLARLTWDDDIFVRMCKAVSARH